MKIIDNIINVLAGMAFLLALCTLETNIVGSGMTILLSGSYLICNAYLKEEEHRRSERR